MGKTFEQKRHDNLQKMAADLLREQNPFTNVGVIEKFFALDRRRGDSIHRKRLKQGR